MIRKPPDTLGLQSRGRICTSLLAGSQIASDKSWRTSNIKLGDAVYAVIQHFQVNPPSILEITDANLRRLQESLTTGSSSTRSCQSVSLKPSLISPVATTSWAVGKRSLSVPSQLR